MNNKVRLVFVLSSIASMGLSAGCAHVNDGDTTQTTVSTSGVPTTGTEDDPFPTTPKDSWNIDTTKNIQYVRKNSTAAGYNATVDTVQYDCGGTDLGFPWYDPVQKKLFVTFGDSFKQHKMNGTWNSNVTLYTSNFNFENGVKWDGALSGQNGASRQITPITNNVASRNGWKAAAATDCDPLCTTTIPTGGLVLNGNYYLFYMEVHHFNQTHDYPGVNRGGMWDVFNCRVVKSTDKGATWTRVKTLEWQAHDDSFNCLPGESFSQVHPLDIGDEYIYVYGIPGGRDGGVAMGRVLKENFEDVSQYEYFAGVKSGQPVYKKGNNGLAYIKGKDSCYVIAPKCGELNFSYNPYYQKYMVSYLQSQSNIVIRLMDNPYAFGTAIAIAGQSNIPCLYGGGTNEVMFDHDGRRMFMFVSQWSDSIYSTHLVEVVFKKK